MICYLVMFIFLPRDASAERGYEIACCPSVCPSVRLSVRITISSDTVFKYVGILRK